MGSGLLASTDLLMDFAFLIILLLIVICLLGISRIRLLGISLVIGMAMGMLLWTVRVLVGVSLIRWWTVRLVRLWVCVLS